MPRLASLVVTLASGCGTYSFVRPAHTLPAGKVEVALGVAASSVEANTVAHLAVGLGGGFEVLAQNEVWNTFGELRYQVLKGGDVDLTVGAGLGYAVTLVSAIDTSTDDEYDSNEGGAGMVSISAGHRWDKVSLTVGHRSMFLDGGYLAASTRLSFRALLAGSLGILLEGGATLHAPLDTLDAAITMPEGTLGFFVGF
ncbi:MAG: hypothetical protein SFX73_20350 [Kofleriaceae bacterium]|nr:hypothetical protein [Kofleriaceae bacterium]